MRPQQLSAVGCGLGLIGCLATVAASLSLVLSEGAVGGLLTINSLIATAAFYNGLIDAFGTEEFDWEPSLAHRVNNWVLAVIAAAFGLLMLAVGIVSLSTFG